MKSEAILLRGLRQYSWFVVHLVIIWPVKLIIWILGKIFCRKKYDEWDEWDDDEWDDDEWDDEE